MSHLRLSPMPAAHIVWGWAGNITRSQLFTWFIGVLLATILARPLLAIPATAFADGASPWADMGAFQVAAWFAVFHLLVHETDRTQASERDFLTVGALCLLHVLSTDKMGWVVATLAATYVRHTTMPGCHMRAAAVVLMAISAQALWGPILFHLFSAYLLHADAALVGTALDWTQTGFTWNGRVIERGDHGIEIFSPCSSFHNVSLAVLCWVTITKLRRQQWIATDFLFGAAACVLMVGMNAARMYRMAFDINSYQYWHEGTGAEIFVAASSTMIVLICLWGSSFREPVARRTVPCRTDTNAVTEEPDVATYG
jgi:hypothetical protein